MPPRRRPPKKSQAPASRVHKIGSREQWDAMLRKAGDTRLVFVQFYQASVWTCKQMRPYFVRYSVQPKFRKAIFAEVDADACEDLAHLVGIKRIPTYFAYWNGEEVGRYEGGAIDKLSEFIAAHLAEFSPSAGPLAVALKVVAAAALVAGGALLASRLGGGGGGGGGGGAAGMTPAEQVLDLKQRIVHAQGRLRNLERANRGKQARAQRKLIEQLSGQVRQLERRDSAKAGGGGSGGGKGGEKGGGGEGKDSGSGKGPRRGPAMGLEEVARLRRRRARGEVLYSDEEEAIEVADAVAGW